MSHSLKKPTFVHWLWRQLLDNSWDKNICGIEISGSMRKTLCCLYATPPPPTWYYSHLHIKVQKNNQGSSNDDTFKASSQKPHYIPENKVQPVQFLGCATAKPVKSTFNESLSEGLNRNKAEMEGHRMILDDCHCLMQMMDWVTTVSKRGSLVMLLCSRSQAGVLFPAHTSIGKAFCKSIALSADKKTVSHTVSLF